LVILQAKIRWSYQDGHRLTPNSVKPGELTSGINRPANPATSAKLKVQSDDIAALKMQSHPIEGRRILGVAAAAVKERSYATMFSRFNNAPNAAVSFATHRQHKHLKISDDERLLPRYWRLQQPRRT